jgi:Cu/Ag efflux pump CusA
MRWLISSALRLAVAMAAAAALVLFLGVSSLRHASVDTLPEFLPTQVQVQTEALGLSAAEVEQLITVPLEDEFNGLAFLDHLRSQSVPGLSNIELTFKAGTDVFTARQLVTERVAQGPAVVNIGTPPVMIQPLSAQTRAMMIGLSSSTVSPIDLSTLARWRIRPRLLAVPGVANVTIWGQRDEQLQVLVDPARMAAAGVSLTQVVNTAGDAMWTSPLTFVEASSPGADGFIDMPNQRLSVQHVLPISRPADLASVPVEDTQGKTVLLGQVSTVVEDHPPLRGDAVLRNGPGLLLVVEKLPGASTLEVTRGIQAAMAELTPGLTGVTVDTSVFRPASYLESTLADIGWATAAGLAAAMLWLGLWARSWRFAAISLVVIALPIVAAAWVLELTGATFTAMALAGFAVALVLVIDDAVSTTYAITRRLSRPATDAAVSPAGAIIEACLNARRPMNYALAILLAGTAPLLLISGSAGNFARAVAVPYLLAAACAALTALIFTPPLAYLLARLRPTRRAAEGREPRRPGRAALVFDRVFDAVALRRAPLFGAVAVLAALGVAVLPQLGTGSLIPAMQDRSLLVQWQAAPGTSLSTMTRTATDAGDELRALPGVRDVASDLGQALLGDRIVDVNSAQTWITVDSGADYGRTLTSIRNTLDRYHAVQHSLLTYPQAALAGSDTGGGPAITVRVYGTDEQVLAAQADVMRRAISGIAGVSGAAARLPAEQQTVNIATDVAAAARVGLKPGDVRRATSVLLAGIPVGSYYRDQQIFDVAVWSQPTTRADLAAIRNLPIDVPSGGQVPLNQIADVSLRPAPAEIDHDDVSRYIDVTADVHGVGLDSALAAVRTAVAAHRLPLGYRAEVSSALQDRQNGDQRILIYVLAAAAAVLLLAQAAFRSWTRAALFLFVLPLAGAGGAATAPIAGSPMTAGALAGFIPVIALGVRHGILLMRALQKAEADAGRRPDPEATREAARRAFAPFLGTAGAVALALMPFTARGDIAGMEILRPFALVVLGGMVSTALAVFVVLPGLYRTLPRRQPLPDPAPAWPAIRRGEAR